MREQSGSEATVMEIDYLRNECVRDMEDDLNKRTLQYHNEVNKGCYRKKKSFVWAFFLPFRKFDCNDGAIWYYCTLCHYFEPITQQETMKGAYFHITSFHVILMETIIQIRRSVR